MIDLNYHRAQVEENGYTIIPDVIPPELVDRLSATIDRLEQAAVAHNPSEDTHKVAQTIRVKNLLDKDPVFQQILEHPILLPLVESLLGPEMLLHISATLTTHPGNKAQPIHTDDQVVGMPRPHRPIVVNAIWAIADFTEENGGTRIVSGSHKWPETPRSTIAEAFSDPVDIETEPVEMKRGSVLVLDGAMWHGSGANRTNLKRMALSTTYCAGWMRQQENFQLSIGADLLRTLSPRLQELCGFGLYQGTYGAIEGRRPVDVLLERALTAW